MLSFAAIFMSWMMKNVSIIRNHGGAEALGPSFFTASTSFYTPLTIAKVLTAMFLLILWILIPKLKAVMLVRSEARGIYFAADLIPAIIFSLLFAIAFEAASVTCMLIVFGRDMVLASGIIQLSLLDLINLFTYFLKMTALFFFVRVVTNNRSAIVIILIWNILQDEFRDRFDMLWFPLNDLGKLGDVATGFESKSVYIGTSVRMFVLATIFFIAAWLIFQKKDILKDEK